MLQLNSTYTMNQDGSATLHVSQIPPNPAIFPPGPARKWYQEHLMKADMRMCIVLFAVVNGIPSFGTPIAVGSGFLEDQQIVPVQALPDSISISQTSPGTDGSNSGSSLGVGRAVIFALIIAFTLFHLC